ncbi:MAG: hypothetical protein R2714_17540 [Microthrixaceae bacterium]
MLYGKPVIESDDALSAVTTTVSDPGDPVRGLLELRDRGQARQLCCRVHPHLFNTSNKELFIGRRMVLHLAHADSVNSNAFCGVAGQDPA